MPPRPHPDPLALSFSFNPYVRIALNVERKGNQYVPANGCDNSDERRPLLNTVITSAPIFAAIILE
jgi:hypothetical protein